MLVVACAGVWIVGLAQLHHDPLRRVVLAASRYDVLRHEPPPGAPPEVRHRAARLNALIDYLQLEARFLWDRGLGWGDPVRDVSAIHNMMMAVRDIADAARSLDYPAGAVRTYHIQEILLETLEPVCAEAAEKSVSPRARQMPYQIEGTRHLLRAAFLQVLRQRL